MTMLFRCQKVLSLSPQATTSWAEARTQSSSIVQIMCQYNTSLDYKFGITLGIPINNTSSSTCFRFVPDQCDRSVKHQQPHQNRSDSGQHPEGIFLSAMLDGRSGSTTKAQRQNGFSERGQIFVRHFFCYGGHGFLFREPFPARTFKASVLARCTLPICRQWYCSCRRRASWSDPQRELHCQKVRPLSREHPPEIVGWNCEL
jgi:hypothetical protein